MILQRLRDVSDHALGLARAVLEGVQQTFGGVSRVIAPIWATLVFQGYGTGVPFFVAGTIVAIVGLMALRIRDERTETAKVAG